MPENPYGNAIPVFTIDHLAANRIVHYEIMKGLMELALLIRCPVCGAKPKQKCELSIGLPRTEPHLERCLAVENAAQSTTQRLCLVAGTDELRNRPDSSLVEHGANAPKQRYRARPGNS